MPIAPSAPLTQPFDYGITAILMQLAPILLLVVGGGKFVVCGIVAYHLAKTRRINRTCAVFAGIFGGITALFLIGMLERSDPGNPQPVREAASPQNPIKEQ